MATHPRRARRQEELQPEHLVRCDLIIRQTFEKMTALFAKVHNLQVEVTQLRQQVVASNLLFFRLLDDPDTRRHAEAVMKDYVFKK